MTHCGPDHEVLVDAVQRSSNHPYISKEGYETLKQQWVSLLKAHQQPISRAERVSES